jgi:hypothetical protein
MNTRYVRVIIIRPNSKECSIGLRPIKMDEGLMAK